MSPPSRIPVPPSHELGPGSATVCEKDRRAAARGAHELGPGSSCAAKSNTVELTQGSTLSMMKTNANIRNVMIIAPSYEKKKLLDSVLAAPGIKAQEVADDCYTCESGDLSLCYEMEPGDVPSDKGHKDANVFLINMLDIPADLPSEANKAFALADGAILVADEDVTLHEEGLISHAIAERVRPVLILNVLDACFHSFPLGGEEVYQVLKESTKKVNKVMKTYDDKLLGDVRFYPEEGTILFHSNAYEWGFTLSSFVKMYARCSGADEDEIMNRIWGDNFYDSSTEKWTTKHTGSPSCKRGFVKLCYEPIMSILDCCEENNKEELLRYLKEFGVVLRDADRNVVGLELMKIVMQTWLPAGSALLGMIISRLPSPRKAQNYRVENLYKGPLNDPYANAIRRSDPCGPLMVYICKTIPSWQNGRSVAVARVFSGTIRSDMSKGGMTVKIIGPNHVPLQNEDFRIHQIDSVFVWKGQKLVRVQKAQPGNIIILAGLDQCMPSNSTVTTEDMIQAYPIRAISLAYEDNEPIPDATFDDIGKRKLGQLILPYRMYNTLFLHQRLGVSWLWNMHCNGQRGAILADDMGLGKTRQVCAFLSGLIHNSLIKKVLIIAPASVVQQWIPELRLVGIKNTKLFTNSKVHGPFLNTILKEGGVMLTTYGVFRNNQEQMSGEDGKLWDYIVMDEGHRAKERKGDISKSLRDVKSNHKVIMTGTPLQNNLEEFFTLMEICNPVVLGDYDDFQKNFAGPIDRGKYRDAELEDKKLASQALNDLKKIVEPFILRRTKALLKHTGSLKKVKFEYVVWLRLSPLQRRYFTALVNDDMLRVRGNAFAAMDVAREISRHPSLLMPNKNYRKSNLEGVKNRKVALDLKNKLLDNIPLPEQHCDDLSISSKLNFIVYMVPKMLEEGHKVLIFSQSPRMLVLIQNALEKVMKKEEIIRMDGSTKRHDRDKLRKAFQRDKSQCSPSRCSPPRRSSSSSSSSSTPPSSGSSASSGGKSCGSSGSKSCSSGSSSNMKCKPSVFLMTTRVGGVGLNLTKASRVIIVDPADNPSDDSQAVDRAYRIGQMNNVIVYRLMSCGDVEEHIFREQVVKLESSVSLIETDPCARQICKNEGLVMRLPVHGFDHCTTHCELRNIYGNKFEISLADLGIENECVVAISNHSLLFSKKEEKSDDIEIEYIPKRMARRVKEKKLLTATPTPTNQITSTEIQIAKTVAERLNADGRKALIQISRASRGALITTVCRNGFHKVLISGDTSDDTKKATKLVENFAREVLSEITQVVYLPKHKTGLIIGVGGATIKSIKERSRAYIEVKNPLRGRTDLAGQTALIVSGNCDAVQAAMSFISQMLNKQGVHYTVEEGELH